MGFSVFLVGSDDRPATANEVEDVRNVVIAANDDPNLHMVTHHLVECYEVAVPRNSAVIWKVGSDKYPALPDHIAAFQKELTAAKAGNRPVVWNHLLSFETVELKPE